MFFNVGTVALAVHAIEKDGPFVSCSLDTSDSRRTLSLFEGEETLLHRHVFTPPLPYTVLLSPLEVEGVRMIVTEEPFSPPPFAERLWKRVKEIKGEPLLNEATCCLRGFSFPSLTVGRGWYADAYHTMNADGLVLDERIVREIIYSKYLSPVPFEDQVYSHTLGTAGVVVTDDGYAVLVQRGNSVAVNRGINVTASGGVRWFSEPPISFLNLLASEMGHEVEEELGLDPSEFSLTNLGMLRELPRGGSPEAFFLISFSGTIGELVEKIKNNTHPDKKEIDRWVFSFPVNEISKILSTPGVDSFIHHKALANLALLWHFLFGGESRPVCAPS